MELVRRCLRSNPQERPTAAEAAKVIKAMKADSAPRMQASRRKLQLCECLAPGVMTDQDCSNSGCLYVC